MRNWILLAAFGIAVACGIVGWNSRMPPLPRAPIEPIHVYCVDCSSIHFDGIWTGRVGGGDLLEQR